MLLISSPNKEALIKALNAHFYSTTYDINDKAEVTWKNGEIKENLQFIIKKGRFQIHQKIS